MWSAGPIGCVTGFSGQSRVTATNNGDSAGFRGMVSDSDKDPRGIKR